MARLLDWPEIQKQISRFDQLLNADQKSLARIDDAIGPERTDDPTGSTAVLLIERREKLTESIAKWQTKIEEQKQQLQEIETAVSQLPERDAAMIRRFYLHQERWESIAVSMHLSRSRFYELLERARSKIEWWLHQDDDRS